MHQENDESLLSPALGGEKAAKHGRSAYIVGQIESYRALCAMAVDEARMYFNFNPDQAPAWVSEIRDKFKNWGHITSHDLWNIQNKLNIYHPTRPPR